MTVLMNKGAPRRALFPHIAIWKKTHYKIHQTGANIYKFHFTWGTLPIANWLLPIILHAARNV